MKTLTSKATKRAGLAMVIVLLAGVGLQLFNMPVTNPPVTGKIKVPARVSAILERACFDCHSNQTRLSWYDKVAPVSWLVKADVDEARSRFNFSTWDSLTVADQQGKVWEMVNMVLSGKMPLDTYATLHPSARISAQDINVLKQYANSLNPPKKTDTAKIVAAAIEFKEHQQKYAATIPVAANGIKYIPDYRRWQVISTTNRFDNHSIRVLYGNAIAVKAINENHIKPWPNGTTLVKAVWNNLEDKDGNIRPGTLNSIQIMIKDDERFPNTKGWGFAKFNGIKLVPYGDTPAFNTTCFNCHKIASDNGYVFNIPLEKADLQ